MRIQQQMAINFKYNYPQAARDAGFQLRQYKDGPLDWRLMGNMEVERIIRDQNLEQIDSVLTHLSEAPLGSMLETNILDSGIAKYFVLSQLSIQFLLFCRTFLDETVAELRESHANSQLEVARLKQSLAEANNEILQLHKKMTQMEAIHEVIFPCHWCTKNFISNEALNIHINRKHADKKATSLVGVGSEGERSRDTPQTKDKEHDIQLINTIKLELEIKQLKERLNTAEKEIRDRQKVQTPRTIQDQEQGPIKIMGRSVGIQSNLTENKEQEETQNALCDESDKSEVLIERKEQLQQMQKQIQEFEQWRYALNMNNAESIAEINKQLADITETLTELKIVKEPATKSGISPAEETVQRFLNDKVLEIGKANTQKLEQIVCQMEDNCKQKLNEFERALEEFKLRKNNIQTESLVLPITNQTSTETSETEDEKWSLEKRVKRAVIAETKKISQPTESKANDETYKIEKHFQKKLNNEGKKLQEMAPSTDSNQTFPKTFDKQETSDKIQSETTDVSESLSEDITTSMETKNKITNTKTHAQRPKIEKVPSAHPTLEKKSNKKTINSKRTPIEYKPFTRQDAKRIANQVLYTLNLSLKTKAITNSTLKRSYENLTAKRNKLKKKYPNFYPTRNRIKKFVDKLCTARLSKSAEIMLNTKPVIEPAAKPRIRNRLDELNMLEHSFDTQEMEATSTPTEEHRENFKERLERILASPIRQPATESVQLEIKADVHTKNEGILEPVPLPRKRVMFDTKGKDSSIINNEK